MRIVFLTGVISFTCLTFTCIRMGIEARCWPRMPKITIHHPDGEQSSFELSKGLVSIGRGPDNDIVLPDGSSSGNHAILKKTGGGDFSVTDLGSTNHTRVNGEKVQTLDLLDGDGILFGDTRAEYSSEVSPGKGGSNRPKITSAPPPPPSHNKISAPPSFSAQEKQQSGAAKAVKKQQRRKNTHPDDGAGAGGCFALLMLPLLVILCLFAGMEARHYVSADKKLLHEELLKLYQDSQAEKSEASAAAAAEQEF